MKQKSVAFTWLRNLTGLMVMMIIIIIIIIIMIIIMIVYSTFLQHKLNYKAGH